MITSLNRMAGMPVVWQNRRMGFVEQAVADARRGLLDGLVIRKGISTARWIGRDDVLLVGESCVIIRRRPARLPKKQRERLCRVFLTSGECVGEVTDGILKGETLRLCALEVCQGPLCRLMGKRQYAAQFRVCSAGEAGQVIVPGLLSWTQLLGEIGEEDEG